MIAAHWGPVRAPSRAAALAAQLTATTGNTARTIDLGGRRTRVEVDLPSQLPDDVRDGVLLAFGRAAIADRDRYGHTSTQAGSTVWAELQDTP